MNSPTRVQSMLSVADHSPPPPPPPPLDYPKPIYESPRCQLSDADLFPSEQLASYEDRWRYFRQQAGVHRQSDEELFVNRRWTPAALQSGVLPERARRIRTIHLALEQDSSALPPWMDVIVAKFDNLEHLYLGGLAKEPPPNDHESIFAREGRQPIRLRRLYILYRLPNLRSIDGVEVDDKERQLARPEDPNGQRVKREDWVGGESSLLDRDEPGESLDDAESDVVVPAVSSADSLVEVDISGSVKIIDLKVSSPKESRHDDEKKEQSDDAYPDVVYESPQSSAVCEWSATCGSLSLPYFRADSGGKSTNGRLRLGFRKQPSSPPAEPLRLRPRVEQPSRAFPKIPLESQVEMQATKSDEVVLSYANKPPPTLETAKLQMSPGRTPSTPKMAATPPVRKASMSGRESPSARTSPSASLTSPFPMQFRVRAKLKAENDDQELQVPPPPPPPPPCKASSAEQITKVQPPPPPPTPPPSAKARRTPTLTLSNAALQQAVPLARVQSSPSKMMQSGRPFEKPRLPPPCPGRRNSSATSTPRRKRFAKWRTQSARATSIMDHTEDDSDVSDEENMVGDA